MSATPSHEESLQLLWEEFRNARHDMNNVFAVLMALAELGPRNPANYERLGHAVLERCPKVLEDLQKFQDLLSSTLERSKTGNL